VPAFPGCSSGQPPFSDGAAARYAAGMAHLLEPAASGRSRCRACAALIGRGELRFGERIANLFGEGEATLWFHPACAAYRRPQSFLEAPGSESGLADRAALERAARQGVAHPRLPRIDGAERSPSGRASCRSCREPIVRDSWRVRLVFFEEGRFAPGGYVHLECRLPYFGIADILDRLLYFSRALSIDEREALRRALL
jgi:hypothetical protein